MTNGSDDLHDVFDQFRDYDRQRTATLLKKGEQSGQGRRDVNREPPGDVAATGHGRDASEASE